MSAETPPIESAQDITVQLKPLLGVAPKHYLAWIYGLILVAILFAILVLPGMTNPGTRLTITTTPPGAAVVYGGKHWGATPLSVFLPQGTGTLSISKPGFVAQDREYTSENSLFLSLFLPHSDSLSLQLSPGSETSVSDRFVAEVGRWALAAPFTSEYRFPPLFSRFAEDTLAMGWEASKTREFLLNLRGAVSDPQMYQDYGRALGLWTEGSSAPAGLEAQFGLWINLVPQAGDRLALWLLANQPKPLRDRETAEPSDWFQTKVSGYKASLNGKAAPTKAAAPASIKTSLGTFRGIAASSFDWGDLGSPPSMPTEPPYALPVPVSLPSFWIAEDEVTQGQFELFLRENPQWAPSARSTLSSQGLVDSDYLPLWTADKAPAPAEPVSSVSWYAARAYAEWVTLSGKVPAGKKAVLPTDFQWEAAARAPGGANLLNQGVWEWTSTSWYPGQSLVWNAASDDGKASYAKSLKGGYQTAKGSVKAGDRAGWPAAGATLGLGFRLALVSTP